jgi:hypothetical protein
MHRGIVLVSVIAAVACFAPSGPQQLPMPRRRGGGALSALRCEGPALLDRRGVTLAGVAAALVAVSPPMAAAQRPPPRPKVSSVPIECKQAGG